ncbi:hypothetical protein [Roseateles sp. YR242]|uniref:hypothetical protein n=1 Tax=Roseateles sp. YR242 TaxID=1855305 RepID=UPI0011605823|nr:hypothetical protein [Roseateles sp. YR242]
MSCKDDQDTHAAGSAWLLEAAAASVQSKASLSRRRGSDSIFQSLMRLWPRDGRRPDTSIRTMARLRSAFRSCLSDLIKEAQTQDDTQRQLRLEAVLNHIVHSRHPQDLWHLRALVYTEVARARSQGEAERRMQLLTAQFEESRGQLKKKLGRG